jgi:hypothetical protein
MQEITGGFMKPPQHTCTEGCPIQTNAACVTGNRLAQRGSDAAGKSNDSKDFQPISSVSGG